MKNILLISIVSLFLISCSSNGPDLIIIGEEVDQSSSFLAQDIAAGGTWCLSEDVDIFLAGDIFELHPHTIIDDYYPSGRFTRSLVGKESLQISEAFEGIWGAGEFELYTETEEESITSIAEVIGNNLFLESELGTSLYYACDFF